MNKKPHLSGKLKRKGAKKNTIPKPRLPGPPGKVAQDISAPDNEPDILDDVSGGGENLEPPISPIVEPSSENEESSDNEENSEENDQPKTPLIPDDNLNNNSPPKETNEPTTPPIELPIKPITPIIPDEENNNNNLNPVTPPSEEMNDNNITSPIEPPNEEEEEVKQDEDGEEIKNEEEGNINNLNEILPPVDPIVISQPLQQQQEEEEGEGGIIEPLSSVQPTVNDFIQPNSPPPQQQQPDNNSFEDNNNNNINSNSVIEKPVDFLPESEYGEGDNYTEPTAQLLFDNQDDNSIYNDNPPPLQPPLFVEDPIEQQQQQQNNNSEDGDLIPNNNNNNNNNFNILPPLPLDDNFNNFNNNYENIPLSSSPLQQPLQQQPIQQQQQPIQPIQQYPQQPFQQQQPQQQYPQQPLPLFVPSMEEDKPLIYEPTTIDQLMQQQQQPLSPLQQQLSPLQQQLSPINNNNQQQPISPTHSVLPPYYPPNSINPIYPQQPSQYPPILQQQQQQLQQQNNNIFSQYSTPPNERPLPPPQVSNTTTQTSPRFELQQQQQQQQLRQNQKVIQRSVLPLLDPTSIEEVAAYYEKELFALFNFYASLQSGKRGNPNEIQTVNLAEFIKCLKDFDVYNPTTKINRIIVADLFRQFYNPNINIRINTLTYEQFSLCFCKCMAYVISDYPFTIRFTSEPELASVMIWLLELDNKIWFKKRCKNFAVFSNGDGDNNGHNINKYLSPSKIQQQSSSIATNTNNVSSNIIQYRLNVLKDNCSQVQSEWIDLPTLFPSYTNEIENHISPINNRLKQPHPPPAPMSQQNQLHNPLNSFKSPRTIGYEKRMKVEKMVNGCDDNDMLLYLQQQQQQQQQLQQQQQQQGLMQQQQQQQMNKRQFKQLQYRIAPTLNIAQQAVSRIPYKPPNMYTEQQSNLNRNMNSNYNNNNNNNNLITWNEINNFSLDNMQNVLTMNNETEQQQQQLQQDQRNPKSRVIQKYINQNISTSPYNAIKPSPMMGGSPPFKQSPVQQHQQQQLQLPVYQPPSLAKLQQQQQQQQIPGNSFSEPPSEIPSGRSIQHSPLVVAKKQVKKQVSSADKPNKLPAKGKKKGNNNFGYKPKEKPSGYRDVYKMKNHKLNSEDNNNNNNNKAVPKLPVVDVVTEEEPPIKVKKNRDIAKEMARRAIEVAREQKLKEKGFRS